MPRVDVLIPTCGRKTGLAVVLACLLNQEYSDFDVIISGQSESQEAYLESREIRTLVSALRWRGHRVKLHRHLPRRGMAEHRNFLLEESSAPYVHFVDDDVVLESDVINRMYQVITSQNCGFVGCPATGLEYLGDYRPQQQGIELWQGDVHPEDFMRETRLMSGTL